MWTIRSVMPEDSDPVGGRGSRLRIAENGARYGVSDTPCEGLRLSGTPRKAAHRVKQVA